MKRLYYLANLRLPTEKAYGVQITQMCSAFAKAGLEVYLIAPFRQNDIKQDVFSYYGLPANFNFKLLPALDFYWPGTLDRIAVYLKSFISAIKLVQAAKREKADIIYSRDELPILLSRGKVVFEAHRFSNSRKLIYRIFKARGIPIVAISQGVRSEFVKMGFPSEKVFVAHDGADLGEFLSAQPKNLDLSGPIIGYVGSFSTFGIQKGLEDLIKALNFMKNKEAKLLIVGGANNPAEDKYYRSLPNKWGVDSRVVFVGKIGHAQIPSYLKACDVLAAPFPDLPHYRKFMSPLKIFEYMASGRPIVASDLPTIREVLSPQEAVLVRPGDPTALAEGFDYILSHPGESQKMAAASLEKSKGYDWPARAEAILKFLAYV